MKSLYLLAPCALLMTACSSNYYIDFTSTPTGAEIICDQQQYGFTNRLLAVSLSEQEKKEGKITIQCKARFASGIEVEYPKVVTLNQDNYSTLLAIRPLDKLKDKYYIDAEASRQIEANKKQEELYERQRRDNYFYLQTMQQHELDLKRLELEQTRILVEGLKKK